MTWGYLVSMFYLRRNFWSFSQCKYVSFRLWHIVSSADVVWWWRTHSKIKHQTNQYTHCTETKYSSKIIVTVQIELTTAHMHSPIFLRSSYKLIFCTTLQSPFVSIVLGSILQSYCLGHWAVKIGFRLQCLEWSAIVTWYWVARNMTFWYII